jgi:hypothetical protein
MPAIDVPPDFIPMLNQQPYNASGSYGKVQTGGVQRGLNYFGNFSVDFHCPNPYEQTKTLINGSSIEFYAGFTMDGYRKYNGLRWLLTIYPPPIMCYQVVHPKSEFMFSNNTIQKMVILL